MKRMFDLTTSVVASSLRSWRGTSGSKKTKVPSQPLQLFDQEGNPACRLVREAMTELNLDTMIYPVPEKGNRHRARLEELADHDTVPFLYDPNTGHKCTGVNAIVTYLFKEYRNTKAPAALMETALTLATSSLASFARLNAGQTARPSKNPKQYLTLYSFESSPYSRLVREKLCELEIPYLLINLGKQQNADMGPAKLRSALIAYQPLPNTKRERFFNKHGEVMVPFLEDPNTGQSLFESADILDYLQDEYAL